MNDLWHKIKRPFRTLKLFVSNLIFWMPIVWTDRWWDYHFLLEVIKKKCARDASMHLSHGNSTESPNIAAELREVADICGRLQNEDNYWEPYYSIHEERWKEANMPSPYARAAESIKQEQQEFKKIMEKANVAETKDLERLGELIKHIKNWWD